MPALALSPKRPRDRIRRADERDRADLGDRTFDSGESRSPAVPSWASASPQSSSGRCRSRRSCFWPTRGGSPTRDAAAGRVRSSCEDAASRHAWHRTLRSWAAASVGAHPNPMARPLVAHTLVSSTPCGLSKAVAQSQAAPPIDRQTQRLLLWMFSVPRRQRTSRRHRDRHGHGALRATHQPARARLARRDIQAKWEGGSCSRARPRGVETTTTTPRPHVLRKGDGWRGSGPSRVSKSTNGSAKRTQAIVEAFDRPAPCGRP